MLIDCKNVSLFYCKMIQIIIKDLPSCFAKTKSTLFNVINYIKSYKILCVCVSVVTYETVEIIELLPFLTTSTIN